MLRPAGAELHSSRSHLARIIAAVPLECAALMGTGDPGLGTRDWGSGTGDPGLGIRGSRERGLGTGDLRRGGTRDSGSGTRERIVPDPYPAFAFEERLAPFCDRATHF